VVFPSLEVDLTLERHEGQSLAVRFLLEGESAILGIAGPSGVGKTTLLRRISGLEPGPGKIVVDGVPWSDPVRKMERIPEDRPVSYLPQNICLFPHMNVRENLLFAAELGRKIDRFPGFFPGVRAGRKKALSDAVGRMAEMFGISGLLDRKVFGLSGGQARKVSLARCFLKPARVYLLDEPLSGIDPTGRQDLTGRISVLLREARALALWVTHSPEELFPVLDGLAVFSEESGTFNVECMEDRQLRLREVAGAPRCFGVRIGGKG
jgi:ABC-type sugar transport system ATPase subunit